MPDQPVQPPAPNGPAPQTPPSEPANPPADPQQPPAQQFDFNAFSDEEKKYLAGQGVTKAEELTTETLRKVINHSQSSQKAAQERQTEIDRMKQAITGQPQQPTNPLFGQPAPQTPTQPGDPSQQPQQQPTQQPTQGGGLDQMQAFMLSSTLATMYPELKDKFVDGSFYREMEEAGTPAALNGQVNLQGIQRYASQQQQMSQLQAKLDKYEKPDEGRIPDANPTLPQQPASDAQMTPQIARAIVTQDKGHPRYQEAKTFLETSKK